MSNISKIAIVLIFMSAFSLLIKSSISNETKIENKSLFEPKKYSIYQGNREFHKITRITFSDNYFWGRTENNKEITVMGSFVAVEE